MPLMTSAQALLPLQRRPYPVSLLHKFGCGPMRIPTSAIKQGRTLTQAKLENQETQIRQLQGALRQMELDRARQQAELNTLSQFWTGNPAAAGAFPALSVGQIPGTQELTHAFFVWNFDRLGLV